MGQWGKKLTAAALLAGLVLLLIFAWQPLTAALTPVFFGLAIAYLAAPFVGALSARGVPRVWGIVLIYLLLLGAVGLLVVFVAPQIAKNLADFLSALPGYFRQWSQSYQALLTRLLGEEWSARSLELLHLEDYTRPLMSALAARVGGTVRFVIYLVTGMAIAFYILLDTAKFKETALSLIPRRHRGWWVALCRELNGVLSSFLRGQLIVALFIGTASAIGLLVLQVPYAPLLGLIAGAMDVIPYFGGILGALPAVLAAWAISPVRALVTAVLFFALQQIESALLSPRIVGGSVGLHPAVTMTAVLSAGTLFGITGMLFAIPAAGMIKVLLFRFVDWYVE